MEEEAGRWPWPRAVYADLIEGLAAQKPRAIVFDMMFVETRPLPAAGRRGVRRNRCARTPTPTSRSCACPQASDAKGVRIADLAREFGLVRRRSADPEARIALVPPLVLPRETYWRTGLINFKADADGVGRRYLLRETRRRLAHALAAGARGAATSAIPVPDQDDWCSPGAAPPTASRASRSPTCTRIRPLGARRARPTSSPARS